MISVYLILLTLILATSHYISRCPLWSSFLSLIKQSIIDVNNHLNGILSSFDSLYKELSSGFWLVDNFPDHFSFYTVNHKDKDIKNAHLCKLNKVFKDFLVDSKTVIVIFNTSIRNNVATSISHVCLGHNILAKNIHYAVNVISNEVKLFVIRCRINQVIQVIDIACIIVITDAIHSTRWIFDSLSHPY